MVDIINQNQLWHCDICNKTIKFKNKSNHIHSQYHKHKEKYSILVKEYEINKPNHNELDRVVARAYINCRNEYFHTFKYVCVYDIM